MKIPSNVTIIEVGPRDGLQNLKTIIPTEIKISLLKMLIQSGFSKIEVTSFVSPRHVPQMSDAKEVVAAIRKDAARAGVLLTALVPNLKGAELARRSGLSAFRFVVSVSEQHNIANTQQTVRESINQLSVIRNTFPDVFLEVSLATAFGCVYEGSVDPRSVIKLAEQALHIGVNQVGISDTIGVANPLQVESLLAQFRDAFPSISPTLHFHDTWGMGLANVLVALQHGYTEFDASIGGLGGCPFAPGAAGNIATEDLNNMLSHMGIVTNINQDKLLALLAFVKENILPTLPSHMSNAGLCFTKD